MHRWQPGNRRAQADNYGGSIYRNRAVTVNGREFRIGMGVRHPKFGEGTVLRVSGEGENVQAEIQFQAVGKKNLALASDKLDIIRCYCFELLLALQPTLFEAFYFLAQLSGTSEVISALTGIRFAVKFILPHQLEQFVMLFLLFIQRRFYFLDLLL